MITQLTHKSFGGFVLFYLCQKEKYDKRIVSSKPVYKKGQQIIKPSFIHS